ncbi:MAG: hypothetical protein LBU51_01740 [Bacteroidales bacterium]|jgi:hypothetical protein|nr:hypothetical protein [Bacteroidales bacterium]
MNFFDFLDKLLTSQYPLATVWVTLICIGFFFFICRKPLIKYVLSDKLGLANKKDIADINTNIENVKKDVDDRIVALKENDFFHTNKAMLIGFSLLLKKDQQQGFERIKDTVLETTPENRRDEIKAITL